MEMINRMRKNRKGFTLVEIIVVLVILAILAAFTIPTMLGFVNDARDKAHIAEAREIYVAAQSIATETYATTSTNPTGLDGGITKPSGGAYTNSATNSALKQMLGSDISVGAAWTVTVDTGKVTKVTYTIPKTDGTPGTRTIIIEGGKTTIS